MERYLRRTATHSVLKVDPDFREFLEAGAYILYLPSYLSILFFTRHANIILTEGDLPKATSTSALSGAGVKRFFNKFGETVNKITYKMDESEPVCKLISPMFNFLNISKLTSHMVTVVRRESHASREHRFTTAKVTQ